MAAEDVEFEANQGTAEQLPQGAASDLNAALPSVEAAPPDGATAPEEVPIQAATPQDFQPKFTPESEDEELLYAPTDRPNEPLLAGLQDRAIPPRLAASLPLLVQAAAQPDASPQLQALVDQVLLLMNQGA